MNNFQNIILFLGGNLKEFVVSVFLKFLLYIALLSILLAVFFSSIRIIHAGIFTALSLTIMVTASFFINRKILISQLIGILNRYPGNGSDTGETMPKLDLTQWKLRRKEVHGQLKKILAGPVPMDFVDCFTAFKLISGKISVDRKTEIRELFRGHINQKLLEWGICILTALPFVSISLLFTAGYRIEMKLLSLIMAVIFFLFIRSAIITPVFSLITLDKISQKLGQGLEGRNRE